MRKEFFLSLSRLVTTGFYSGLFPWAPGTAGSAACLILWWLIGNAGFWPGFTGSVLVIVLTVVAGLWATHYFISHCGPSVLSRQKKSADPSFVVIDEWAGMLIALLGVPQRDLKSALLAFALFRFFDIIKPFPVRRIEKLPGAWGIIFDDVAAGVLAWVVLFAAGFSRL